MGTFWVRAWDHLETRREYDLPTLTVAGLMALSLVVVAWMIMRSQVRAWKDAEERVSFANRVSHELGTPLTNMTLNLDLAARSLRSDPEKAGQRLEKVREEVARLARLVGNVLTRTRKEQGLLQGSPSANVPDELIGDVLSQFQPALERREIEADFKKGAATRILVDPDAFSQIVWNLISNVEKHAATGGWLGIESAIKEDELTISVSDWGPGISEEDRGRIFTAFERVHAKVTEGTSGTGLGLSISLDLARMMGGSLELLSGDEGAHFQLTIPAVKP
jgi:signal transduction histidine kinase